jgi:uncharacterized protein
MKQVSDYKFITKISDLPFVNKIYLYGSRARNDSGKKSDIDLAIVCPEANTKQWHQILDIIENADTLLDIDCVRYDKIVNQNLKSNIDREKQVIYAK